MSRDRLLGEPSSLLTVPASKVMGNAALHSSSSSLPEHLLTAPALRQVFSLLQITVMQSSEQVLLMYSFVPSLHVATSCNTLLRTPANWQCWVEAD